VASGRWHKKVARVGVAVLKVGVCRYDEKVGGLISLKISARTKAIKVTDLISTFSSPADPADNPSPSPKSSFFTLPDPTPNPNPSFSFYFYFYFFFFT
jgi:hypothetical protein